MITHKKYTCPLVICYIAIEKGPFIVDLPMKDGDFPVRYVCLPEGNLEVIWEKPRRTIRRWALHVNIIRLLLPYPLVIKTWLAGKISQKDGDQMVLIAGTILSTHGGSSSSCLITGGYKS